jgi:hypothetical protein
MALIRTTDTEDLRRVKVVILSTPAEFYEVGYLLVAERCVPANVHVIVFEAF